MENIVTVRANPSLLLLIFIFCWFRNSINVAPQWLHFGFDVSIYETSVTWHHGTDHADHADHVLTVR